MTRLIYNTGYNSGGVHIAFIGGKRAKAYGAWRDMLERCYNPKAVVRNPNYKGCIVADDWHDYQDFAEWYYGHKYSDLGYQLDKDLLIPDNKIYSPKNCCFVPQSLNKLLTSRQALRGDYPQGVNWHEKKNKYVAQISIDGKKKHIGYFDDPQDAYDAYKKAKEANVKRMADLWFGNIEPRVYEALMDWSL